MKLFRLQKKMLFRNVGTLSHSIINDLVNCQHIDKILRVKLAFCRLLLQIDNISYVDWLFFQVLSKFLEVIYLPE